MKSDTVFRMSLVMTICTQANQIGWRIIKFISIYVMNMKIISPSLSRFTTGLASPFVSIFNISTNRLPIKRVIPLSNSAFPCGIIRTANGTGQGKGFSLRSCLYAIIVYLSGYCRTRYAKLIGNILQISLICNIFLIKPILIFIKFKLTIMTRNINVPIIFSLIPGSWIITTTLTQWRLRIFWRNILYRFTLFPIRVRSFCISNWNVVSPKNIVNTLLNHAQFFTNSICTNKRTVRRRGLVHIANQSFNFKTNLLSHKYDYSILMNGGVA